MIRATNRTSPRQVVAGPLKKGAGAVVLALGLVVASSVPAHAATTSVIDFSADGYTEGLHSPDGQNSWVGGGTDWDFALVDNADVPASGAVSGRSLRISNAVFPSSSRYLQSPEIEAAGEPGGSVAWNTFETSFTLRSATGAVQPGLNVDVNLDAASRYGGVVNFRHTSRGLEIGSYWVPESATDASLPNWQSAVFAVLDPTQPHQIRISAVFNEGASDSLDIYVDGEWVTDGAGATTWEHYERLSGGSSDATVNEISFRAGRSAPSADGIGYTAEPAAPATEGLGFLFSDLSYGVSTSTSPVPTPTPEPTPTPSAPPLPTEVPVLPAAVDPTPDAAATLATDTVDQDGTLSFSAGGFAPFENVFVTIFSTPVFGGWFQADAAGTVTGTLRLPAGLDPGTHSLQLTGATSGWTAVSVFQLTGLASSGSDPLPLLMFAGALLGVGGVVVGGARRRRS